MTQQHFEIDPAAFRQAGAMFCEIAHSAHSIKRLTSMVIGGGVTTLEDEQFVLVAIEALAERAGMLADMGAGKFGQVVVVGGLVDWTMPPAYFSPEQVSVAIGAVENNAS